MTLEKNDYEDPASVDPDKVRPMPGLGSNFENVAYPALTFSTKAQIWGDKRPESIEPTDRAFVDGDLRRKTLARDGHRCMYCGFHSQQNQVHNLNDNHRDVRPENLRAADVLCHGWQHLGELGADNAVIAYLPGLNPQDANHLQRTIMVALNSDDETVREDARKLLNWMASHRDYAKEAWGTCDPGIFAAALVRLEDEDREKRSIVFQDLSVVFNPVAYGRYATAWAQEAYRKLPSHSWQQVYHDVMNAPA